MTPPPVMSRRNGFAQYLVWRDIKRTLRKMSGSLMREPDVGLIIIGWCVIVSRYFRSMRPLIFLVIPTVADRVPVFVPGPLGINGFPILLQAIFQIIIPVGIFIAIF